MQIVFPFSLPGGFLRIIWVARDDGECRNLTPRPLPCPKEGKGGVEMATVKEMFKEGLINDVRV